MNDAPPNHPGDESLLALSLGQLPEAELVRVSAHLGNCPECCRRIDQLATDDRLLTRLKQKEDALVAPAERRQAVRAFRRSSAAGFEFQERAPVVLPVPKQIGDYEILGEVGRGGMGVVYKARHRGLNRLAAVKMVLAGEFASPAQELRFRLEAELAARVQHPNFVQVYEVGSHGGRLFLALEWVEGGSLANRLNGEPWSPNDAAALTETLARAIGVAHGEGVVHRDLKPANILLTADGVPKIADFGLAQTVESSQSMTMSGFLVGTPGYMAPEQATGNRALVGPASDIYALGVVLYQLLTGRLPFEGDSALELLRAVTSDEPPRPRRLLPRLSRDLEAITLHCLEKVPAQRYPTALALAEDLERFRMGAQVSARPVGTFSRLVRAGRRRPVIALLLALLAVTVLAGVAGVTWKWLDANEQRDRANANSLKADAEKQAALYQAYRAGLAAASASLENHDVADAARHLDAAPEELRGWEWRHLHSRLDDSSATFALPAEGESYLIAAPDRVGVLTSAGLRIMDIRGRELGTVPIGLEQKNRVDVAQTSRGLRIAAWVGNTTFDVLDDAGKVICRVVTPENTYAVPVVFSPDGARLCVATDDEQKRIAIYSAISGKRLSTCSGHLDAIRTSAFSPDGTRLATGSEDRTLRIWDPASGKLLETCRGHTGKVLSASYNSDGTRLLSASSDGTVRQWDAETGRELELPYERHFSGASTAAYSDDGRWVASAGYDRTVRVWGAQDRREVAVLHGHADRVTKIAFASTGQQLVTLSYRSPTSGSGDATARVWDVAPRATLPVLHGHTRTIYPIAYSPDGRWIASGSWDNTVRLWDAATGEHCATFPHSSFVWGLAFGPDGTWLMTGCNRDDRLRIWDVATARVRKEIPLQGRNFRLLTVSPDGTRAAVTSNETNSKHQRLTVFDIASEKSLFTTEATSLAYSPDGRWLAALGPDVPGDEKTVLLLDARTHEVAARFSGHEKLVFSAAFSTDGHFLATCSRDKTVRLWRLDNGECQVFHGHTDEVYAVAFHPDGTRLATGCQDGSVWLWDVEKSEALVRLPGHKSFVWSLAFSPDGAALASGSGDATIRLWDTSPLKARYEARREAAALRPGAERLVERLWREKNGPDGAVQALRADRDLSEALRQEAFRAVLRRIQPEP